MARSAGGAKELFACAVVAAPMENGAPQWLINTFGVAAGLCSMASFIPQIVKIWRERCATGVSVRMYVITIAGFCCWLTYGLLGNAWPVAAANSVCVVLTLTILVLRLRFGEGQA